MIVIDTMVVSELMQLTPALAITAWFSERDAGARICLAAVSEAELRAGVAFLRAGRRWDLFTAVIDTVTGQDFAGRVLPFDSTANKVYASVAAFSRFASRPILEVDCQIAAIARARDAALATGNAGDFGHCGIAAIYPRAGDQAVIAAGRRHTGRRRPCCHLSAPPSPEWHGHERDQDKGYSVELMFGMAGRSAGDERVIPRQPIYEAGPKDSHAVPTLRRFRADRVARRHVGRHARSLQFPDGTVSLLPGYRREHSHLAGMGGRAGETSFGEA